MLRSWLVLACCLMDIALSQVFYENRSIPCYDNTCYTLYEVQVLWEGSQALCKTYDGILATPKTDAFQKHLGLEYSHLNPPPTHGAWLAGTYADNEEWAWSGLPDNHGVIICPDDIVGQTGECVSIQTNVMVLSRDKCAATTSNFICRKDLECSLSTPGCVVVYDIKKTWFEARDHCDDYGMKLFFWAQNDYTEYNTKYWIEMLINSESIGGNYYWIGYNKRHWNWKTGPTEMEEMTYTSWENGKPNEQNTAAKCVALLPSGQWDHFTCGTTTHFICSKQCDCPLPQSTSSKSSLAIIISSVTIAAVMLIIVIIIVIVIIQKRWNPLDKTVDWSCPSCWHDIISCKLCSTAVETLCRRKKKAKDVGYVDVKIEKTIEHPHLYKPETGPTSNIYDSVDCESTAKPFTVKPDLHTKPGEDKQPLSSVSTSDEDIYDDTEIYENKDNGAGDVYALPVKSKRADEDTEIIENALYVGGR